MALPRLSASVTPLVYIGIFVGFYRVCSSVEGKCKTMVTWLSGLCTRNPIQMILVFLLMWPGMFSDGSLVTLLDTMDTRNGGILDWKTFTRTQPPADDVDMTVGWRESSVNLLNGDTVRIYRVCNVDLNNVDNWVRTPYIARGDAHRLYVEMRFTMRKCTKHPDQDRLQQCKESFKLYFYEAESDFANENMPTWDKDTYKHVDVVAADQVFTGQHDYVVNTEVRSVPITRRGVYFAFHDEGACTSLQSIRVYYKICSSTTLNFATFPNTTAGPELSSIIQRYGTCVNRAAIEKQPSYLCKADGSWYLLSGGCKCMPGYEPEGDQNCTACPVGKYKWRTGSYACSTCPIHSEAPHEGSVECHCVQGYYRNITDDKSAACTRPPSPVRNLIPTFKDQSMVNISWNHPEDLGGRRDIYYSIDCSGCTGSEIYRPTKSGFNSTKASVIGLSPSTSYKIIVIAANGVSRQSGITAKKSVVVTTKDALPKRVQKLRVVTVGQRYVTIAWESAGDVHMEEYEIRHYPSTNRSNVSITYTHKESYTFGDLFLGTNYTFEVRGKMALGWGEFSQPVTATTGHIWMPDEEVRHKVNEMVKERQTKAIIAASVGLVGLCMIIVIVITIIFCRRNQRPCHDKNVSDCDTLQYSNGEVQCPPVLDIQPNGLTVPLFSPPGAIKTYIDPHTYEDPNQAVREFTKEIDASFITIESVIGGGEFGDVCKGKLNMPIRSELTVAIKTLKAGASDKNRLDFLTEASIMGQFDDPNVIYLEGVVTKSNPIMIVTEYMENGSLDTFLRNNDGKFTVHQLVGMMRGIAAGMRYLADMGYVHRDLAARNILVNDRLICKVADFGLSREIEADTTEGAYTTKGGKIPVRWTAPEAIAYRKFTSASDVWSFGVVMWEIMSYGERPYWNWSNQDVIKHSDKGFRLPPPMDCPEAIHQLMLDCWQKERSHRPKFSAIVKTLDKLIRAPELLRKAAKPRPHNYLDPNAPDLTSFESIEDWLTSIKMERYTDHFLQAGFTTMDQVAQVTLKDLITLGVTLVGHQKKIMNSVQTLRAQMSGAQVSEGFLV